jgi:tRNA modification GTPase
LYVSGDTIVAISTANGLGAIGIVRVSGPLAFELCRTIFKSTELSSNKRGMFHGFFNDPQTQETLDEGLLLWMPGPHSATGEDVAECQVHGSPAVLQRLVSVLIQAGARPAEPGEFTYRAFQNGRLDLAQAEAVQSLVAAHGEQESKQALRQLTGGLTAFLKPVEERLKDLYLQIEARIEFPEDGIAPLVHGPFLGAVKELRSILKGLLESYSRGLVLRRGFNVALVGAPNVGKSSLLNALLGTSRAIVTHIPGTTRDVIEGEMHLSGIRVRLFDTAGLRETDEHIEAEGIRRSKKTMEEADLVLWVLDSTDPKSGLEESIPTKDDARVWWVYNKTDLANPPQGSTFPSERTMLVSCRTNDGIEALVRRLEGWVAQPTRSGDILLLQERHQLEVRRAEEALGRLECLVLGKQSLEIWAEETREALHALGRIRGLHLGKEAFEEIFSQFCIGK